MTIEQMLAQMNAAAAKTGKTQPKARHNRATKKQ
jgi:hypothetical protein